MASVVINGDTSGSVTLQAPAAAGATVLTLPSTSGTIVITSGAQTIEFADGSASTPSITNSGDTNTGMFFPAADTIAFAEGGVEAMRLDASGNVGIGTTSPGAKLDVVAATNNGLRVSDGTVTGVVYASSGPAMVVGTTSNHPTVLYSNNAERMRITSAGAVGIGTTTPAYILSVNSSNGINSYDGVAGKGRFVLGDPADPTGYVGMYRGSAGDPNTAGNDLSLGSFNIITFRTGAASFGSQTERMRIDSSGNVLVNTTGTWVTAKSAVVGAGTASTFAFAAYQGGGNAGAAGTFRVDGTGTDLATWYYQGGVVGRVTTNSANTTYGTSSDYRLKENITPMIGALDTVAQLKPVTYKWKQDGSDGQGFIAHELQEIVPDAVQGEKDAVDEEGNPIYQGIDTSFLVATLTAAIQEQQTIINDLKARIETLETK